MDQAAPGFRRVLVQLTRPQAGTDGSLEVERIDRELDAMRGDCLLYTSDAADE